MNYGELIDIDFKPERDNLYQYFTEYFNNPILTKIKNKENYSVYMSRLDYSLSREYKYLIVTINKDYNDIGFETKMINIKWISLQTRTLFEKNNNVSKFVYIPKRYKPLLETVTLVEKNDKCYTYKCDNLPFIITLLPDLKGDLNYNSSGNIINCLEQFQTIINFIDNY